MKKYKIGRSYNVEFWNVFKFKLLLMKIDCCIHRILYVNLTSNHKGKTYSKYTKENKEGI